MLFGTDRNKTNKQKKTSRLENKKGKWGSTGQLRCKRFEANYSFSFNSDLGFLFWWYMSA